MRNLLRSCAVAWLLAAVTPVYAATPTEFYLSLLRRGVADVESGQYQRALRTLRIAAFGMVDYVEPYQTAQVYLAVASERLGMETAAGEAARRVLMAQRVEPRYLLLQLTPAVRTSFEAIARKSLGPGDLAMLLSTPSAAPPRQEPAQVRSETPASPDAQQDRTTPPAPVAAPSPAPQIQAPAAHPTSAASEQKSPEVTEVLFDQPPDTKVAAQEHAEKAGSVNRTGTGSSLVETGTGPPEDARPVTPGVNRPVEPENRTPVPAAAPIPPAGSDATTSAAKAPAPAAPAPVRSTAAEPPKAPPTPPGVSPPAAAAPTEKPATAPVPARPVAPPAAAPVVVQSRLAEASRALEESRLADARAIYRPLLDVASLERETMIRIAEGLYRARDFAGALEAFGRLGELRNGEEPYRYYLSVALYETGQYGRAKKELSAALPFIELTPDVVRYRAKIEGSIR